MSETPKLQVDPSIAEELAHAEKALTAGDGHAKPAKSAASKGKKKKKGSSKNEVPLTQRIKAAAVSVGTQFIEISKGLTSRDRPTRRMSLFFFTSLLGVLVVAIVTFGHYAQVRYEKKLMAEAISESTADHIKGFLTKQAEDNRLRLSMVDIGSFTVELKPIPGQKPHSAAIANMGELTLVLECDSPETHTFIEGNLVQIRSQITDIFVGQDRDELLTREGKRKLKQKLIDRINSWLPSGKINNVFFSKLVVA